MFLWRFFRKFSLPCSLVMGALGYLLFANVPFLVPIGDYCGPRLVSLMPVVLFSLLYVTFCKIEIKEMKPKAWHFILQLIRTSLALMMVVLIFEFGSDYSTKLILEGAFICFICPTAAAVAVCRAIEALTDIEPKIKWVNDVYVDGKKVCGILTEAITDFETQTVTSIIIGIGVNITTTDFADSIENAGCINCSISRARLAAEIANQLNKVNCADLSPIIDYYRSHSMIIGEDINYIRKGVVIPARAVAIDSSGGLEVEHSDGSRAVLRSGEISVRKR